jgi:hypothetical protein
VVATALAGVMTRVVDNSTNNRSRRRYAERMKIKKIKPMFQDLIPFPKDRNDEETPKN